MSPVQPYHKSTLKPRGGNEKNSKSAFELLKGQNASFMNAEMTQALLSGLFCSTSVQIRQSHMLSESINHDQRKQSVPPRLWHTLCARIHQRGCVHRAMKHGTNQQKLQLRLECTYVCALRSSSVSANHVVVICVIAVSHLLIITCVCMLNIWPHVSVIAQNNGKVQF